MNEKLIALLGLKADATEDQIVAAVKKLAGKNDELTTALTKLQDEAKAGKKGTVIDSRVSVKMRAGLTFEQATEVVAAQDQADAEEKKKAK